MIRKVTIRRFKRFSEVEFVLPGHVVLAGPNNCGKTTLLQAIATWSLALNRWKQLNDFQRHGGAYAKAPLAHQAFFAVPLRAFDILWNDRRYDGPIEIEVENDLGCTVTMELLSDSSEQIYVRPNRTADPQAVRTVSLQTVYVPAMTGLGTDEPVYRRPKVEQLLGQGKPGDVIRNLLVEAHQSDVWPSLQDCVHRLFGYEILPPDATGADIIAEYRPSASGPELDIASAGSGFQQVLMLLTFLHTRSASVLLLDEPDAHLHVILQDAIYGELKSAAAQNGSQLIIATHAEVIINSVDPTELCMVMNRPSLLSTKADRRRLAEAMGILTNMDISLAETASGVLFTEDYTDLHILREWARILRHPIYEHLLKTILCRSKVTEHREGAAGIPAREYYDKLTLVCPELPGVFLVDGNAHPDIQPTPADSTGLQRLRWKRYEIESYLFHPEALARYVTEKVGPGAAAAHIADLRKHLEENYPPAFLKEPLKDAQFLIGTKARTDLLPPALAAAGLPGIPYTRYNEIAAVMQPEEIHPEVKEKLDEIQRAFNL